MSSYASGVLCVAWSPTPMATFESLGLKYVCPHLAPHPFSWAAYGWGVELPGNRVDVFSELSGPSRRAGMLLVVITRRRLTEELIQSNKWKVYKNHLGAATYVVCKVLSFFS